MSRGRVAADADRRDEAGRALAGLLVLAVVAFDQLRAFDVVDLVVLVARIGDPAAGEAHQAALGDRLALPCRFMCGNPRLFLT
jgi:hypothetical protein